MPHREILNTGDTPYTLLAGQLECPAHKQVPVTDAQLDAIDERKAHRLLFDRGVLRVLEVEDAEEIREAERKLEVLRQRKDVDKRSKAELARRAAEKKDEKASDGGRGKGK